MSGNVWDLFGAGYSTGLVQISVAAVLGAAILYAKHGIGTFGLCVIAGIAGYAGSWYMLSLWGGEPSLLTCELLGGFFGVATASIWLRLRQTQVDDGLTTGDVARPAIGK
jgi:hypothetical protein